MVILAVTVQEPTLSTAAMAAFTLAVLLVD